MKTVSPFEYAIMLAAHEADPSKVTKEDLSKVRPFTPDEVKRQREDNIRRQISRLKIKSI
jgi:hypothetical protein